MAQEHIVLADTVYSPINRKVQGGLYILLWSPDGSESLGWAKATYTHKTIRGKGQVCLSFHLIVTGKQRTPTFSKKITRIFFWKTRNLVRHNYTHFLYGLLQKNIFFMGHVGLLRVTEQEYVFCFYFVQCRNLLQAFW